MNSVNWGEGGAHFLIEYNFIDLYRKDRSLQSKKKTIFKRVKLVCLIQCLHNIWKLTVTHCLFSFYRRQELVANMAQGGNVSTLYEMSLRVSSFKCIYFTVFHCNLSQFKYILNQNLIFVITTISFYVSISYCNEQQFIDKLFWSILQRENLPFVAANHETPVS